MGNLGRYYKRPIKKWEGEPLCVFNDNTYFFDLDELRDYIDSNDLKSEDIPLMICTPNKLWELDPGEIYEEIMPENQDDFNERYNKEVIEAFDKLNEFIRGYRPISWGQGPFRTTVEL